MVCQHHALDHIQTEFMYNSFNSLISGSFILDVSDQQKMHIMLRSYLVINSFNSLISGSFILDVSDHYPSFTTLNIADNDPVKHIFRDHSIENINKLIDSMPNFQRNFNLLFNYDVNKKQNGLLKNCGNYTIVAALKKLKLCHIKLISSHG